MRFKILFFALGLLNLTLVHAQSVRIVLVNCKFDEKTLKEISNSLDFQVDFYANIFANKVAGNFTAKVFGTEKEFRSYFEKKHNFVALDEHTVALFDRDLNEMILHTEVDNFSKVFSHELSHALLFYYCGGLSSRWLNEGLAEFHENVVYTDSTYVLDRLHYDKISFIKARLSEGSSIKDPIVDFFGYSFLKTSENYSLSMGIILYLYQMGLKNPRLDILERVIREDCSGIKSLSAYPGGINVLAADVRSYFLNYSPNQP